MQKLFKNGAGSIEHSLKYPENYPEYTGLPSDWRAFRTEKRRKYDFYDKYSLFYKGTYIGVLKETYAAGKYYDDVPVEYRTVTLDCTGQEIFLKLVSVEDILDRTLKLLRQYIGELVELVGEVSPQFDPYAVMVE